jgi:hypothetical protein
MKTGSAEFPQVNAKGSKMSSGSEAKGARRFRRSTPKGAKGAAVLRPPARAGARRGTPAPFAPFGLDQTLRTPNTLVYLRKHSSPKGANDVAPFGALFDYGCSLCAPHIFVTFHHCEP